MVNIAAFGSAIADYTAHPTDHASILLHGLGIGPWIEKHPLTPAESYAVRQFRPRFSGQASAGGSAANILWTLQGVWTGATDQSIHPALLGCIGNDENGRQVRASLELADIHLLPSIHGIETAVSYVINHQDGRTILKDNGDPRNTVRLHHIPTDFVPGADALLVSLQTAQRMGWDIIDHLITQRWHAKTAFWGTLPTDTAFLQRHAQRLRFLTPSMDMLFSNIHELRVLYSMASQDALRSLQKDFDQNILKAHGCTSLFGQEAFITCGAEGAAIVPADDDIIRIPTQSNNPTYQLGAGDAATGAYLAGRMLGLSREDAGYLAMRVAAKNMQQPQAHTDWETLIEIGEGLAADYPLNPIYGHERPAMACAAE